MELNPGGVAAVLLLLAILGVPYLIRSAHVREPGVLDDYDRVLLQLDSSNGLIWSDCGWAVFMIRRADLLARDFSRVAFSWESS